MKRRAGYTLVEALTVIAIVALISGITLVNYSSGSEQRRLKQAVDNIVLSLSRAQQNALGGASIKRCSIATTQSCNSDVDCPGAGETCVSASGYGVHFTNNSSTYDVFADLSSTPHCSVTDAKSCLTNYDCDPETCVKDPNFGLYVSGGDTATLPSGINLLLRSAGPNAIDNPYDCAVEPPELHIAFQPPRPSTTITDGVSSGRTDENGNDQLRTCAAACFFVTSSQVDDVWRISVRRATGAIDYRKLSDPNDRTCPYYCSDDPTRSCVYDTDCLSFGASCVTN